MPAGLNTSVPLILRYSFFMLVEFPAVSIGRPTTLAWEYCANAKIASKNIKNIKATQIVINVFFVRLIREKII